jgi:hypothetical protein
MNTNKNHRIQFNTAEVQLLHDVITNRLNSFIGASVTDNTEEILLLAKSLNKLQKVLMLAESSLPLEMYLLSHQAG